MGTTDGSPAATMAKWPIQTTKGDSGGLLRQAVGYQREGNGPWG
jgi:hypothetical protein